MNVGLLLYFFFSFLVFENVLLTGTEYSYSETMSHRREGLWINIGLGLVLSRVL